MISSESSGTDSESNQKSKFKVKYICSKISQIGHFSEFRVNNSTNCGVPRMDRCMPNRCMVMVQSQVVPVLKNRLPSHILGECTLHEYMPLEPSLSKFIIQSQTLYSNQTFHLFIIMKVYYYY